MKIIGILVTMAMFIGAARASQHQYMTTVGSSAKGQFVALEEYGYKPENHAYYVTIRLINVWTSEDVGTAVQVEIPASDRSLLEKARAQAKVLSLAQFEKYNIISH